MVPSAQVVKPGMPVGSQGSNGRLTPLERDRGAPAGLGSNNMAHDAMRRIAMPASGRRDEYTNEERIDLFKWLINASAKTDVPLNMRCRVTWWHVGKRVFDVQPADIHDPQHFA